MHLPENQIPMGPIPPVERAWPWQSNPDNGDSPDELQNWSSLIGIIIAICGNVLISLALNVQRYAHIRLHRKRLEIRERARQARKAAKKTNGTGVYGAGGQTQGQGASNGHTATANGSSTIPIIIPPKDGDRSPSETDPLTQSFQSDSSSSSNAPSDDITNTKVASTYLKDPYWWLGQALITVGESGNFLAYGFAPASIVSPLGVVAIVSNCVIAPLFFNEIFRAQDFWGVLISVAGAVTVVLSAQTEETKLGPREVWEAITTVEFEVYTAVCCAFIATLMWLSPRYGSRTILIDLGLVGLFGGYTALATKGVSSMLSSNFVAAFTTPITYVLAFVLLSTALMQVRYLNKALQRFDSTQVIPTQFVLFTISVIIGSAVLYRDFERTTAHQALTFVGGCLFTFFGVFLITTGRPRQDVEEEGEDEVEEVEEVEREEETVGLAPAPPVYPQTPPSPPRRTSTRSTRARRSSSRASYSSIISALWKPSDSSSGLFTPRSQWQKPQSLTAEPASEAVPLLGNLPEEPPTTTPSTEPRQRPTTPSHRGSLTLAAPSTPARTPRTGPPTRPSTSYGAYACQHHYHHHPHPHPVYSPSPFSSTLSAVVADTLLAHTQSASYGRPQYGSDDIEARTGSASGAEAQSPLAFPTLAGRVRFLGGGGRSARGSSTNRDGITGGMGRVRSLSITLGLAGLFGGGSQPQQSRRGGVASEPLPGRVAVPEVRVTESENEDRTVDEDGEREDLPPYAAESRSGSPYGTRNGEEGESFQAADSSGERGDGDGDVLTRAHTTAH